MPTFLSDSDSIAAQIQKQSASEGTKPHPITPIVAPVLAEAHTPVYKMHRYFARRPHNVFEYLIKHYTHPGDLVLDPFHGGGVTVVEALRARRKVVGVDLNPMATFITRMEVTPVDVAQLRAAFAQIEETVREKIEALYFTRCPECYSEKAIAEWYEWSNVVVCGNNFCKAEVVLKQAKKLRGGVYQCPACQSAIAPIQAKRLNDRLLHVRFACGKCNAAGEKDADAFDEKQVRRIARNYAKLIAAEKLRIPSEKFPDADRQRDDALFQKGITHFRDLFTQRNLLGNALIKRAIATSKFSGAVRELMILTFSATLAWTSIMTNSTGHGWQHHGYWLPNVYFEMNVWEMFRQRFSAGQSTVLKGKEYSMREIGSYCEFAQEYADLKTTTCLLLNQSSDHLPLPPQAVDVIITDPPFGGNVQYAELSYFWTVWLKELLEWKGIFDNAQEAVQTRHTGFATEKSAKHYEDMLYRIFKECRRVLKPNGWMVMTFHNRDIGVWMALHRAANRAGFRLPPREVDRNRGMTYQPPIAEYTTTLHQRAAGSMLGDFILSFQRQDISSDLEQIKDTLEPAEESALIERTRELIDYNGGGDENLLMTGLLPFLNERNLLHRLARFDFRTFFDSHFIRKGKTWYTEDQIDTQTRALKPFDFIPAEKLTQDIIYAYLKEHRYATLDDLLNLIYTTLVNSQRPGIETIHAVLNRIAERGEMANQKRPVYYLTRQAVRQVEQEKTSADIVQKSLFDEDVLLTQLDHNAIILRLMRHVTIRGYAAHIGETEQIKESAFRAISTPMTHSTEFGLPPSVFDTVKQIDLLALQGYTIVAVFEVATTVETANKAINDRYRNLFAAAPNLAIRAYVIVKDQDFKKAREILYTPANALGNLIDKVKIIRLSQLTQQGMEELL